jgi:hypothetical protein
VTIIIAPVHPVSHTLFHASELRDGSYPLTISDDLADYKEGMEECGGGIFLDSLIIFVGTVPVRYAGGWFWLSSITDGQKSPRFSLVNFDYLTKFFFR